MEIFYFVLKQCKKLPEILLNAKNFTGETPLHFAVSSNNVDIARMLIEKIQDIITQLNINMKVNLNPSSLNMDERITEQDEYGTENLPF